MTTHYGYKHPGMAFEEQVGLLKDSIFIPPIGNEKHRQGDGAGDEERVNRQARRGGRGFEEREQLARSRLQGFMTGLYGTQRQTVILVDWDGNVSYTERALRGCRREYSVCAEKGTLTFTYKIEGWDSE